MTEWNRLKILQDQLETAQTIAKVGSWDRDVVKETLHWSEEGYRILGLDPLEDKLTFQLFLKHVHPEDLPIVTQGIQGAIEKKSNFQFEYRIVRNNGEIRYLRVLGRTYFNERGELIRTVGTMQDITAYKIAELKLHDANDLLATIFNQTPDAIDITRWDDGSFVRVNHAFSKMCGLEDGDLTERFRSDHFLWTNINDHNVFKDQITQIGMCRDFETSFFKKDGSKINVQISASLNSIQGTRHLIRVTRDLTEKSNLLLTQHQLEAQLIHADKLALIGTLAAGVGHEINNPLAIIKGHLEMLQKKLDASLLSEEVLNRFETMDRSVDRIATIVKSLRSLARIDLESSHERVDVHQALTETLTFYNSIFKRSSLEIETDLSCENPIIAGNSGKLQQVFINLLSNAKDAMESNVGRRLVSVGTRKIANQIVISISDNGTGIENELLTRIFDPFFTTKRQDKGTGLGLSISNNIIREFGGTISVASRVGQGTTFEIRFPLVHTPNKTITE